MNNNDFHNHDDNIQYSRRKLAVIQAEKEAAAHGRYKKRMKYLYVFIYSLSCIIFTLIGHYAQSYFTLILFNLVLSPFAAISAFVIANDL